MPLPLNAIDKLIDKIQKNVGRPGDSTLADYTIEWINQGQRRVCNRMNLWFMHRTATLTFLAGDLNKALPADFKDENGVWILDSPTNSFSELDYMDSVDYRRIFDDVGRGFPTHYILDGSGNIMIRDVPDKTYSVVLDYWGYLTDVASGGATNVLIDNYPDILEAYGTWKAFSHLTEFEDASIWKNIFEESLHDLVIANNERVLPDEMVLRLRPGVKGTGITRFRNRG